MYCEYCSRVEGYARVFSLSLNNEQVANSTSTVGAAHGNGMSARQTLITLGLVLTRRNHSLACPAVRRALRHLHDLGGGDLRRAALTHPLEGGDVGAAPVELAGVLADDPGAVLLVHQAKAKAAHDDD